MVNDDSWDTREHSHRQICMNNSTHAPSCWSVNRVFWKRSPISRRKSRRPKRTRVMIDRALGFKSNVFHLLENKAQGCSIHWHLSLKLHTTSHGVPLGSVEGQAGQVPCPALGPRQGRCQGKNSEHSKPGNTDFGTVKPEHQYWPFPTSLLWYIHLNNKIGWRIRCHEIGRCTSGAYWIPLGRQIDTAEQADQHPFGGLRIRVHNLDVHSWKDRVQRRQHPASGSSRNYRGCRPRKGSWSPGTMNVVSSRMSDELTEQNHKDVSPYCNWLSASLTVINS